MKNSFWDSRTEKEQKRYIKMLQLMGSLSNLFSESKNPYLAYRIHENLFCHIFNAKNQARGDISYDATKDNFGIGLKTFLHKNGKSKEKVAEFNAERDSYIDLDPKEMIIRVSELRNKRLQFTKKLTEVEKEIYHLVTRSSAQMNIIELPMKEIDLNSIKLLKSKNTNAIHFKDRNYEYTFSLTKHTLFKRFHTEPNLVTSFGVDILDNPFDLLEESDLFIQGTVNDETEQEEAIVLPLYSPTQNGVPERSGLNQWNASGRKRHPDEVYIGIPSWIHTSFPGFFYYSRNFYKGMKSSEFPKTKEEKNSPTFTVELPSGRKLQCKVAQSGGKALMSNPNKELGEWLLRELLTLPRWTIVTMDHLKELGIDSITLTKRNDTYYLLDFASFGAYEKFQEDYT